jgi:hypothetical protein
MKVTLIGKVRYSDDSLYKVSYDKPTKYFCEHCREKKGKVSFIEVSNTVKNPKPGDGIGWCKDCTYSIDIGEDTPTKSFKKGQKVYYLGWNDTKIYCKFLFTLSDDYCRIELKQSDGSLVKMDMKFEDVFSDEETP